MLSSCLCMFTLVQYIEYLTCSGIVQFTILPSSTSACDIPFSSETVNTHPHNYMTMA